MWLRKKARAERRPSLWYRFKTSLVVDAARVQKRAFLGFLLLPIVIAPVELSVVQAQAQMVDRGIIDQVTPLSPYLRVIVILSIVGVAGQFLVTFLGQRVNYLVEYDLRLRIYRAIHAAELKRLDRVASGQLITRSLSDLATIEGTFAVVPVIAQYLPIIVGTWIFVFVQNPTMAAVAVLPLPVNMWLLRKFAPRLRALSWAELNERAEVAASIDEPVKGIRVVKAFGREEYERGRVRDTARRAYSFAMSRWRLLAKYDIPMKAVPVTCSVLVVAIGALLLADDRLSVGTFLISIGLSQAMGQIASVFDVFASTFQYLNTAQNRITEVLRMGEKGRHDGHALPAPRDGLALRNVVVELGGRRVLDGIDLIVRPGVVVAVVGPPGSGKSTLAAVVGGLLSPDAGDALLDGGVLAEIDPADVYRAVKIVSEDSFLFAGSIRENLELGLEQAADESTLREALHAAGVDDFIDELPQGIDTPMGDRGLTVSGGQRQRIALARAVITKPRVLVLDDGLSAVNPSLEVEILVRIRSFLPDTAVIAISRRTAGSTVADSVVHLPAPDLSLLDASLADSEGPAIALADMSMAPAVLDTLSTIELSDEDPGASEESLTRDSPVLFKELIGVFRSSTIVAAVAVLGYSLIQSAPELFTGNMADLAEDGDTGAIWSRAGVLMLIGLLGAGGYYFCTVYGQRVSQGTMYLLRRRVFQRLSKLGVDHYDRELPGQVAARVIYDLDIVGKFVQRQAFDVISRITVVLGALLIMIGMAPSVAPVVIAGGIVIYVVGRVQTPITQGALNRARDQLGVVVTTFEEDCSGREDIRAYGAVERQEARFRDLASTLKSCRRAAAIRQAMLSSVIGGVGKILGALVLFQAGNVVLAGGISIGTAITVRLLSEKATTPITFLGSNYTEFLQVRVSWDRLKQPFDVPILPRPNPAARPVAHIDGDVELEGVRFAYPHTGREVLHNVTMHLPSGSVTALVGATGSGKSSIAKLVARTYDPDHGRVLLGGDDLRDLDFDSYRSHIGVVPQDAFLFRGTVRSNIAYGRPAATDEEIEEAARAVGAHEMLSAMAAGYDHPVEEEARNLTAAQRQLIALARAWITDPKLLILDEATSCLDARLERHVLESVGSAGRTTLTVTHRDHVASAADHVVVLHDGEVVEEGPPSKLKGAGGAYDRLWVEVLGTEAPIAGGNGQPVQ